MKSPLQLQIRCDASPEIGAGDVMRMLTLAQGWRARGGSVVMACGACPEALRERVLASKAASGICRGELLSADPLQ